MRHDPEVQRAVSSFQLGLPRMPVAGRTGELLGRSTGSSLEFQEYREYLPGDDIRHVDWAAYARSDALMVRLFREEISPRLQVLLDASRSMTTGEDAKWRVAQRLAAVFALLSGQLGGRPEVIPLDDRRPLHRLTIEGLDHLTNVPPDGTRTLPSLLADHAVALGRRSVRIVISDFLFPHNADLLVKQLASEASVLWVVQVLTSWEANPDVSGGRKLIDVETTGSADLILDKKTVDAYRDRLKRLQEGLALNCQRAHARFVTLVAEKGLNALCRDELCRAEMLRPI
jgi:uncharacterized protein (DUF58 family)